jgi:hypothetical protein
MAGAARWEETLFQVRRRRCFSILVLIGSAAFVVAQAPATSGTFVLHKFANPTAAIHNTRSVWRTVAAGAVYEPAPLWSSVGFTP